MNPPGKARLTVRAWKRRLDTGGKIATHPCVYKVDKTENPFISKEKMTINLF
jgi:hypothetical protein